MRKSVAFFTVLLTSCLCSCHNDQDVAHDKSNYDLILEKLDGTFFTGNLSLLSTEREYLVMFKKENTDYYERGFIVQHETIGDRQPSITNEICDVILVKTGIMIIADRSIQYFGVDTEESRNNIAFVEDVLNKRFESVNLGFGFASTFGKWQLFANGNAGESVYNVLTENSLTSKLSAGNFRTKDECTSGGEGSTSCSIDEPFNGCTVECSSGYYSCCMTSTTRCICVKNGEEPKTIADP